jgi:lipopolysaccharide transport protein LptA
MAAAPAPDVTSSAPKGDELAAATKKNRQKKQPASKEPTTIASKEPTENAFGGLQFSSGNQPINIDGPHMELNYPGKSVLWTGHVKVVNGNSQITSDSLRLNYGENFHDVKEMIADGNVRISQGTRWATGDHAVLDQTKHTVTLTGSPVVHDGEDQIAGSKITVHLDTNQSDVENARAVIYPKQQQTAEAGSNGSSSGNSAAPASSDRTAQPPPSIQGSPTEDSNP